MDIKLLPHKFKYIGYGLITVSLFFGYLYFLGGKPEFFNVKVFAIYSVYIEKKSFAVIQTNILDELFAILLLTGLLANVFSRQRFEHPSYNVYRVKAIFRAIVVTVIIWVMILLLIYGLPVFIVSSSVFILFLITYSFIFTVYRLRNHHNE